MARSGGDPGTATLDIFGSSKSASGMHAKLLVQFSCRSFVIVAAVLLIYMIRALLFGSLVLTPSSVKMVGCDVFKPNRSILVLGLSTFRDC